VSLFNLETEILLAYELRQLGCKCFSGAFKRIKLK
jgi:hypothetical protein